MDIVKTKNKTRPHLIRWLSVLTGLILITVVVGIYLNKQTAFVVDDDSVLIGHVQQGDFDVNIRGTGVLVPEDIRWISSNVSGRIERIHAKAGTQVSKGDILMDLSNHELQQQLEEAEWQLEALEAEVEASRVLMESELLDQKAAVMNERLNYERARLSLNAQDKLLAQGGMSVSQIAYAENEIDAKQFKQRWQFELERLEKKKQSAVAQQQASTARVNLLKNICYRAEQKVSQLVVKASMNSIVQEMPLELGQQIVLGTNLAKLARNDAYIAQLRIPEKLIKDVIIGKDVVIDTRTSQISGNVKRIDLAVVNGAVQVDVSLHGPMPKEVRPDLTVSGVINIHSVKETLYVKRPMFVHDNTERKIFRLEENEMAQQTTVRFGIVSSQHAQIKSGLQLGDAIIVSDTSDWPDYQQIKIN